MPGVGTSQWEAARAKNCSAGGDPAMAAPRGDVLDLSGIPGSWSGLLSSTTTSPPMRRTRACNISRCRFCCGRIGHHPPAAKRACVERC